MNAKEDATHQCHFSEISDISLALKVWKLDIHRTLWLEHFIHTHNESKRQVVKKGSIVSSLVAVTGIVAKRTHITLLVMVFSSKTTRTQHNYSWAVVIIPEVDFKNRDLITSCDWKENIREKSLMSVAMPLSHIVICFTY